MSNNPVNPSYYADFGGLTALKKDVKANDPKAMRAVAQQFESLFTEMMLKSMREAKLGEGLGDSEQSDLYQDMYDQQIALRMSQGKGLGLADMLVQQLTRSSAAKKGVVGASSATAPASGVGQSPAKAAIRSTARVTSGGTSSRPPNSAGSASAVSSSAATSSSATAHSVTGAATNTRRLSFIQALAPYAQRAAAQLGVSADSLIAQAALETGWGQHVPATHSGASSYNLFGIKSGTAWAGDALTANTTEYSRGAAASVPQTFRAYSSLQQGVNDYVSLLRRSANYQQVLGSGDDIGAFASALQRGGYASDPDYVNKLVSTAATVRALRAGAASSPSATAHSALKLQDGMPTTSGGEAA